MRTLERPSGAGRLPAEAIEQYDAEHDAAIIRCYSGPNTPELLATPRWARAVHAYRSLVNPRVQADGDLLRHRQTALQQRPHPQALFIVNEEALLRLARCPQENNEATEQLQHLHMLARQDNHLSLRIRSITTPLPPPPAPFTITSDTAGRHLVFEGDLLAPAGLRVHRADAAAAYVRAFDDLTRHSLGRTASCAVIDRALQHRRTGT